MKPLLRLFFVMCVAVGATSSAVRHVPASYATIQSAINAATHGDTILVAPGTYYENIHFRGKNIVVASHFILSNDPSLVLSTIINGSTPQNADSASCVRIVSGEDTSAVLEGFTLTGGVGTRWRDEHGAGVFREGGGILVTLASPTIRNNVIIDNEAINTQNCISAGGGGIRLGDSRARILNNVIMSNKGMYGGGIVLNYCSGVIIRNNLVVHNTVYQATPAPTFGGGGIWILLRIPGSTSPNIIENNTVIGNNSSGTGSGQAGRGGGVVFQNADVIARNNIIWSNTQDAGGQIFGSLPLTYSNVEGGYAGTGNVNVQPLFEDSALYLSPASPLIDAGDPDVSFSDPEQPGNPGVAEWPSQGTTRNDMGAYGGPGRSILAQLFRPAMLFESQTLNFGYLLPDSISVAGLALRNQGNMELTIDSARIGIHGDEISITNGFPLTITSGELDSIRLVWSPDSSFRLSDTLFFFHNDPEIENPVAIELLGSSVPTPVLQMNLSQVNFGLVDVNVPQRDTTFIVRNIGTGDDSVYVGLEYQLVQPPSALQVSPTAFALAPGDSQAITFTFFPPLIVRVGLSIYTPIVLVHSQFGDVDTHYAKRMNFRLIGTLDAGEQEHVPRSFLLEQNYPNPFNPKTTIMSGVPQRSLVELKIFDALGREVATLVNEVQDAGTKSVEWDGGNKASGAYVLRMKAGDAVLSRKMILAK